MFACDGGGVRGVVDGIGFVVGMVAEFEAE